MTRCGSKAAHPRKPRALVYGDDLLPALIRCWVLLRTPAGKILAPFMPVLVPLLRAEGEISLSDEQAELLAQISAVTINRMLADEWSRMRVRGRTHTKPGSLLKHQIPRIFADWDNAIPGFVEVDLVAHDGGIASEEYCYTLTMTDIARHRLYRQSLGAQPSPQMGRRGDRLRLELVPLSDQGHRLRQRQRVH